MDKDTTLETLRALLLEDDRALNVAIGKEVDILKEELLIPENFAEKVDARTEKKLEEVRKNFGTIYKKELQTAIQHELKDSQEEVINALYPIIGKLIKKYIQAELESLSENIDNRITNTFSVDTWVHRVKAFFSGSNQSEIILSELATAEIEEIFMIQKNTGLLIGSYSKQQLADKDMIAGMLTAISSFVEHALSAEQQSLNTIEYENAKILIQDFPFYKLAFVVKGVVSAKYKEDLADLTFSFAEDIQSEHFNHITNEVQSNISEKLKKYFIVGA